MSELHGYMTVMLDAGDVAAGLREAQAQRYDAADLDLGWAAYKTDDRPNLACVEHGPKESRATNGHVAIRVPCATPRDDGRVTKLTAKGSAEAAKLAAASFKTTQPSGVRLSAFGGYVTADIEAGRSVAEVEPAVDAGPIPEFRQHEPADDPDAVFEVHFNAAYMAQILAYFARHAVDKRMPNVTLRVRRDDEKRTVNAMTVIGRVDGGLGVREAVAILMPCKER